MTRQADVETLAVIVAELVDEFRTTEIHDWRPSRAHPDYADPGKPLPRTAERRVHRTREPGLLEQLRRGPGLRRAVPKPDPLGYDPDLGYRSTADAFALIADMAPTPGSGGSDGGHTKPTSKPPAGLHAAETLLEISVEIAEVRRELRAAARLGRGAAAPAPVMLRELLDLVLRTDERGVWLVPDSGVGRLVRRARSWSATARLALSYDAPMVTLRDRHCAECGGVLRVRRDASSDVRCAGIRGRVYEGPALPGAEWPIADHGCGATWPRIAWLDLLTG